MSIGMSLGERWATYLVVFFLLAVVLVVAVLLWDWRKR